MGQDYIQFASSKSLLISIAGCVEPFGVAIKELSDALLRRRCENGICEAFKHSGQPGT